MACSSAELHAILLCLGYDTFKVPVLTIAHHSRQPTLVSPFFSISINFSQLLERRLKFGDVVYILYITHFFYIASLLNRILNKFPIAISFTIHST